MNGSDTHVMRRLAGVDVYLVDLILEGRFGAGARVVDLGAGGGRNLTWFLTSDEHYDVHAVEPNPEALAAFAERRARLGVDLEADRIHAQTIEDQSLAPRSFDLVILNAVLHFATDAAHFDVLVDRAFDLVAPGGILFARLATTIGVEGRVQPLANGWYALPDGSTRFLADEERIAAAEERLGAVRVKPLKTTVVERLRAMTTWVLTRP